MILDVDFPPDDRPEKEALSLIEAGHEVHLLCPTWSGKSFQENYKGIHISRFKIHRKLRDKLSAAYLVLPFYKWIWQKQIIKYIKHNGFDVLHLHDLPMTDIVNKVAQKYDCNVVCDQHEYWSNWIGHTAHYNTFIGKIVKGLSDWKIYERRQLSKADLVITVTDALRKCYIKEVGLAEKKVITIPNTPTRGTFKSENVDQKIVKKYKKDFILFYAGVMDILRGLDIAINSLKKIEKIIPNVKLLLAGRFASGFDALQLSEKNNVRHLVEFVGWLSIEDLPSYIASSKICLFTPHVNHSEINNTIATKIYQYVAMHKPIITSTAKMQRDFILDNQLGYAIDPSKPNEFYEKVVELYQNYETHSKAIKENGIKLMKSQPIFWDQTVNKLIQEYLKF